MPDLKKLISLEALQEYHLNIKNYIDTTDSEIKGNYPRTFIGTTDPSVEASNYPGIKVRDIYLKIGSNAAWGGMWVCRGRSAPTPFYEGIVVWQRIDYDDTAILDALDLKVDKVTGKDLSTNDFTDELKNKLDGIDLTNYVTNTDYAQNNGQTGGVVKLSNGIYGIKNVQGGIIGIIYASDAEIEAQTSKYRSITPFNLSKAVKEGVTNNSITLTAAEKQAARDWIDADGGTWEKLVDKTLESNSTIALNFSDFNFNGQYKKIKVQIRGQMQTANSNISFYRMNNSSAYQVFGQVGMTTDALYEFDLSESPYLNPTAIRDSSVELKVFNVTSNSWQQLYNGKAPVNQKMNETYELKVVGSSNFLANTRVVVWGCK